MASVDPIEAVNAKSLEEFAREYLPGFDCLSSPPSTPWSHPTTHIPYTITLTTSTLLSPTDLESCFQLIKSNSHSDYQKSKNGWNPRAKRAEMKLLDLKYLLVKGVDGGVKGFLSFMLTWEDGWEVVYCYEIHLGGEVRGTGLGALLMQHLRTIAQNIPQVSKIMLTCFTRNTQAMGFYTKLGFVKDEFSPEPRVLRDGRVVEESYVILKFEI